MKTKTIIFLTEAAMRIAIKELMSWKISLTQFKIVDADDRYEVSIEIIENKFFDKIKT